ncbi:CocE/NonD family hydrolase C-terminal non-catalytic domain-containing protein [Halomonas sp. THAF12]|uniref:CocE/NonD family hydrolase C-terminal non-catalytic domain-containing protein n=1 Tax=Halomonas sp. B23F22_10 TaxID=3459515 RepID=UPI00373DFF52
MGRGVRVIENAWIPMADGARLAAKLWLPAGVDTTPAPVVIEYIPYRKRDFRSPRDSQVHGYFARHGYAAVRVDLRGSGDSDGLLRDEYLPRELEDGGSLCFDTPPLEAVLEILGQAVVELELAADRPQAMVAVRLSDIAPDGSVTRVTYGLLNLSHRHGHRRPSLCWCQRIGNGRYTSTWRPTRPASTSSTTMAAGVSRSRR